MNNTTAGTAQGSIATGMQPLTFAGVKARLHAAIGSKLEIRFQGVHSRLIDSARQAAACDAGEARLSREISEMHALAPGAGEMAKKQNLVAELAGIVAVRKVGTILDDIVRAGAALASVREVADAATAKIEALQAEATALDSRLAELDARDVIPLRGKIAQLRRELRLLGDVILHGKWKRANKEEREITLKHELGILEVTHGYIAPTTETAARERITRAERELDELVEAMNNQLTDEEFGERHEARRESQKIHAEILKEAPHFEEAAAAYRTAEATYSEHYEVALIAAESAIEVYEITCGKDAASTPG